MGLLNGKSGGTIITITTPIIVEIRSRKRTDFEGTMIGRSRRTEGERTSGARIESRKKVRWVAEAEVAAARSRMSAVTSLKMEDVEEEEEERFSQHAGNATAVANNTINPNIATSSTITADVTGVAVAAAADR